MAIQDRAQLYSQFENNDVPTQPGFQNMIDSAANLADTARQNFAGAISTSELATSLVSATTLSIDNFQINNAIVSGTLTSFQQTVNAHILFTQSARSLVQPLIVSAAGTTQGTATFIAPTMMARLQGVTDGTATGFILDSTVERYFFIVNETAASANLYPPTGGTINALGTNAAFGMTAKTGYTVMAATSTTFYVK